MENIKFKFDGGNQLTNWNPVSISSWEEITSKLQQWMHGVGKRVIDILQP